VNISSFSRVVEPVLGSRSSVKINQDLQPDLIGPLHQTLQVESAIWINPTNSKNISNVYFYFLLISAFSRIQSYWLLYLTRMFLFRALLTDRKKYQFVKFKKAIQEQYLIRFIIFFLELANLKLKTYSIVFTWVLHHPKPEVEEMVLHRRRRPSSIRLGSGGDWCRTRTRSPGRRDCRTGPSVWRKKRKPFSTRFSISSNTAVMGKA